MKKKHRRAVCFTLNGIISLIVLPFILLAYLSRLGETFLFDFAMKHIKTSNMPYISIESGKLTAEQKKQLIERLTVTASEITHIPEQFFTVTIKELPDENFGIGGKSIDEIKRNYKS